MSEGEEYIANFFDFENIKFESEVVIFRLKDDEKAFRKADFFLPKYGVYVEFFGQWNSNNHKERYRRKKKVYKENSIPCIYLYPENLGIIEYIFHKRLITELKYYGMRKKLRNYRFRTLWRERSESFVFLLIGILILIYNYPWLQKDNQGSSIIGILIVLYQLKKIRNTINNIFKDIPINRRFFN